MADNIKNLIPKEFLEGLNSADEAINKIRGSVGKLMEELSKTNDLNKTIELLTKLNVAGAKLADIDTKQRNAKELLGKAIDEQNKAQKQLDETFGNSGEKTRAQIQAEKALQKQKDELLYATQQLDKVLKQEAKTKQEAFNQNKQLLIITRNLDVTTEGYKEKVDELNKKIDANNKILTSNLDTETKRVKNIGNYSSAFEKVGNSFGSVGGLVVGAVKNIKGAFDLLAKNPLLLALGLLAGAIKLVFDNFKEGGKVLGVVNKVLDGLNATFAVAVNALTSMFTILVDIFTFNWKDLGKDVNAFGDNIKGSVGQVNDLYEGLQRVRKLKKESALSEIADTTALAKINRDIAEQEKTFRDKTKDLGDRRVALNKYKDDVQKLYEINRENALREVAIATQEKANFLLKHKNQKINLQNSKEGRDLLLAVAKAEAGVLNVEAQRDQQLTSITKLNKQIRDAELEGLANGKKFKLEEIQLLEDKKKIATEIYELEYATNKDTLVKVYNERKKQRDAELSLSLKSLKIESDKEIATAEGTAEDKKTMYKKYLLEVEKLKDKARGDELKAELKLQSDILDAQKKATKESLSIFADNDKQRKLQQTQDNELAVSQYRAQFEELKALADKDYEQGKISKEQYNNFIKTQQDIFNKSINDLNDNARIEDLQNERIANQGKLKIQEDYLISLEELLSKQDVGTKAYEKTKEAINEAKNAINDLLTSISSAGIEIDKIGQAQASAFTPPDRGGWKEFFGQMGQGFKSVGDRFSEFANNISGRNGVGKIKEAIGEVAKSVTEASNAIQDVGNSVFDFMSQQLENEQDLLDERYDMEKDAMDKRHELEQSDLEALGVSDAQKNALKQRQAEEEARLEEEKEKQDKILRRKQAEQDKKQAVFNATLDLIKVTTQLAVQSALLNIPGIVAASIGVALASVQLAKVSSMPLPAYKMGRKGGKKEVAIVGDGGVSEYVVNKHGKLVMKTPNTPTIVQLREGDSVIPNEKKFIEFERGKDEELLNAVRQVVNGVSNIKVHNDVYTDSRVIGVTSEHKKRELIKRNTIK